MEYGFWGDKIIANSITAEKLAVGAISNGSNYIRNGSFEGVNGVVGEGGTVSYWKNGTDPATSTPIDAVAYRATADGTTIPYMQVGDECAKITAAKTIAQTTDALSGDTYVLSFYYLFANSGSQMSYTIDTHSTGGTYSKSLIPDSTNTNKWAKEVCKITVQDGHEVTVSFSCTNGTGYVDAVILSKGSNIQVEYSPHVSEVYAKYTAINEDGVNIYGGHLAIYDADGHKKIYTQGQNLIVSGNILADYIEANTAGSIAGWKIDSDLIYKSVPVEGSIYDKRPTGWSSNSLYPAFWAGSDMTTIPSATIPAGSTYPEGFNSTGSAASGHGANFMLLHDGKLFARNADITGAIHATSLTLGTQDNMVPIDQYVEDLMDDNLGGWQIHDHYLSTTELQGYFTYLLGEPSQGSDWVIRAGTSNGSTLTTYFGVHADGCMYCRGAEIYGDVFVAGNIHVNDPNGGSGITKLGGSWTIGAYSLYTTNLGTSADNPTYILNDNNTFMLHTNGNAYSKGSFFTGRATGTGIQISDYNIFFGERGSADDSFDTCCGAISLADDNSSLALSGYRAILFGEKVGGGDGNIYGWGHRASLYFSGSATVFAPVTSYTYYQSALYGEYFKLNTGEYKLYSQATSSDIDETGSYVNARTPRYDKYDSSLNSYIGSDSNWWSGVFSNTINTGSVSLYDDLTDSNCRAELYFYWTQGTPYIKVDIYEGNDTEPFTRRFVRLDP